MIGLNTFRQRKGLAGLAGAALFVGMFGVATTSFAQVPLPPPSQLVPHVDLKCSPLPTGLPPLNAQLILRHLNPVLIQMQLAPENVIVTAPQELCVPIFKNGVPPPANVRHYVQFFDFVCYGINTPTPPPNVPLTLRHLNPQLANAPLENIVLTNPRQLCLPVNKFNAAGPQPIPPEVRRVIEFIDLKCYDIVPPQPLNRALRLHHLNPLLLNQPIDSVNVTIPERLCVPVQKFLPSGAGPAIPPDVLNVIRWIDIKKYQFQMVTPPPPVVNIPVRHLNPLFANTPILNLPLLPATRIGLPVAKNNVLPTP